MSVSLRKSSFLIYRIPLYSGMTSCSGKSETKVALSRLIWLINLVLLVSGSILVAHLRHQSKIRRGFIVFYFMSK